MVFYHTNAGGNENPVWLFGNEADTFGPLDDVRDISLVIHVGGFLVFNQLVSPGTYEFEVPIVEESPETEFGDEGDGEFDGFSGTINPRVGENFVSFTIPEDYSLDFLYLGLDYDCVSQTVEAELSLQGVAIAPDLSVDEEEGECFIDFRITDPEYLIPGETYDVVIRSETDEQLGWSGSVELQGVGVSLGEEPLDEPYFSGVFDPITGEDTVSFTIPNNYSANYFTLEFYAECDNQSIAAAVIYEGESLIFTDMAEYQVLGDGLCGVWLNTDDATGIPLGETFEVVIRTETDRRISWSGTVALEGDGVTRDDETVSEGDQGLVWEELFSGEIDAEHYMTLEIPEGGRQVDGRAITTRFENQEVYVDPYLVIFDENNDIVAGDNNGGEDYGYGDYSSRLNVFLEEGSYTLLATTYDLWDGVADYLRFETAIWFITCPN